MNTLIYAGDYKYYTCLLPIAKELKKRGNSYYFVFNLDTQVKYLTVPQHRGYFNVSTNVSEDTNKKVYMKTLGLELPFTPDNLIVARERWQPEQGIIQEAKERWDTTIYCVEVSSHLINNIECRLEMLSRTRYPQSKVDYYLEHSSFASSRRVDCLDEDFKKKSIVVGNCRFGNPDEINTERCITKYNIDPNKKQILFWGVINTTRNTAFKALKHLKTTVGDEYQIFYKCYPGEPTNERFTHQFHPFIYDDITVIYDDQDTFPMAKICDTHIGAASSIFNFAFMFNKKIVNLDSICKAPDHMNDISRYTNETNVGVEDSAKFWMRVWGLNTIEELKDLIELDRVNKFKETNKIVMDLVKNHTLDFDWDLDFLNQPKKDYSKLLKIFDDYNLDGQTQVRIVDLLENKNK